MAKCCVGYKRLKGAVPLYIEDSFILNSQDSQQHSRATRYSNTIFFARDLIECD